MTLMRRASSNLAELMLPKVVDSLTFGDPNLPSQSRWRDIMPLKVTVISLTGPFHCPGTLVRRSFW